MIEFADLPVAYVALTQAFSIVMVLYLLLDLLLKATLPDQLGYEEPTLANDPITLLTTFLLLLGWLKLLEWTLRRPTHQERRRKDLGTYWLGAMVDEVAFIALFIALLYGTWQKDELGERVMLMTGMLTRL